MKITISWLKDLININISNKKLIKQLIMLGIEVEKITNIFSHRYINKIFISGKIIYYVQYTYNKFIYTIDFGSRKVDLFSLKDVRSFLNKIVIVILPKRSKKLFCDFLVYNYFDITEGEHYLFSIVEIDKLGNVLNKDLNLTDKWLKLSIALNRIDLKNLIGICREIYALNKKVYSLPYKESSGTIKNEVSIQLKTDKKYFFYVGRLITDVFTNQIPLWMYNRLLISERLSPNPLLNIINYVFIETGIIINIYDVEIIGKELIITTKDDYLFTTNKKHILYSVGSFNNNFIKDKSKDLYIESISLTNEFIQDYTQSNLHYCIYDSNILLYAIKRVSQLITNLFGGNLCKINIFGKKNKPFLPYNISFPIKKIKDLIGQTIRLKNIQIILKNLKFHTRINSTCLEITPPIWRRDIHLLQDIVEEIIKFYGFDRIKLKEIFYKNNIDNIKPNEFYIDKIKSLLINKGYQEIITYSLIDIKLHRLLFSNTAISIINPISNELSCIRNSLLNGLLTNIIYNQNYQANRLQLFELGICYDLLKKPYTIKEKCMLAGAIYGNKYEKKWCFPYKLPDLYDIKGDIENIFEILTINPDKLLFYIPKEPDYIFYKNYFGYINYENNILGKFGIIDSKILNLLKIKNQIIYFELNLYKILPILDCKPKIDSGFSYLPIYERDLSFVVKNDIPSILIIQECKIILKKYLLHIEVFDIYADKKMKNNNEKSIGINIILQDRNKTMNNKEINLILDQCIQELINKFKIQFRQ